MYALRPRVSLFIMKGIFLKLFFFLRVFLLVMVVAVAGRFQIVDGQLRMHGFIYFCE